MKTKTRNNIIKNKNIFDVLDMSLDQNYSTSIVVPFVCSDSFNFSSRFLKASFERYHILEQNFRLNKPEMAKIKLFKVRENNIGNNIIFVSMPCHDQKRKPRKISYRDLILCMSQVSRILDMQKRNGYNVSIHAPKFGTGISGGNWNIISELINDTWSNYEVNIYEPL